MVVDETTRSRLTREVWISAALDILATEGVDGVAVERLAEQLGVTKGSFYWHFRDRAELITAALGHWALERTAERISSLLSIPDPHRRLRELIGPGEMRIDPIDLLLVSSLSRPEVAPILRDHHRVWLEFAQALFRQLGVPEPEAALRGLLAYGSYLGLVILSATNPDELDGMLDGGAIADLLDVVR